MMDWKEVSWTPLASETWREQHFHATETNGANGDGVFVWELVGLPLDHFRGRFVPVCLDPSRCSTVSL